MDIYLILNFIIFINIAKYTLSHSSSGLETDCNFAPAILAS